MKTLNEYLIKESKGGDLLKIDPSTEFVMIYVSEPKEIRVFKNITEIENFLKFDLDFDDDEIKSITSDLSKLQPGQTYETDDEEEIWIKMNK